MKFVLPVVAAALLAVSGIAVTAPSAEDGSGLVMSKCAACHSVKRICRSLGKKDLAAWKKTNQRMADMGMTVTAEELDMISNYLANAKPGTKPVCE
ncbi:c-type cytochrome [Maridesulfovibrio sp. FT414]|uniref:c-type cytochrome n=1 Tax=Maridesulfovibrio sp. FT414 TaxID=2979469 RepID=UPI003D809034